MASNSTPNYPDILGYITDGEQFTVNGAQFALAAHPRKVRAGRAFRGVLLIQNLTDANLNIDITFSIPKQDARRQQERFKAKTDPFTITVRPAEVGYMSLPVAVLPDTAPGDNYKIGVDVNVKPLEKARRVRQAAASDEINLDYYFYLSEDSIARISELKSLEFSAAKRGLFGKGIEATFTIGPAQGAQRADLKPAWTSLWALGAHTDARPLLERHHEALASKILPQFHPLTLFETLHVMTQKRLKAAHYDVKKVEAHFITKLLVYILLLAVRKEVSAGMPGDEEYFVAGVLRKGWPTDGRPIPMPHWCRAMLTMIGFDERVMQEPIRALAGPLYDELLRDAIIHGFRMVQHVTGENLGSAEDVREYTEHLINLLRQPKSALTVTDVYLPLVMGGVIVCEETKMPGEEMQEVLHTLLRTIKNRIPQERGDDNTFIFAMTEKVLDRALIKYGHYG